jgi:hypothetical protein
MNVVEPGIGVLSRLTVPVKVKVCVPAAAVRVTFAPLRVPVIVADPLLHGITSCDNATE